MVLQSRSMTPQVLSPNLFRFQSGCNVYIARDGSRGIAVDLGDGSWLDGLAALGITRLDGIFLTHHHADQCSAPPGWRQHPAAAGCVLHAPAGEEPFLDPQRARAVNAPGAHLDAGCPASYSVPAEGLPGGLAGTVFDMAGFSDLFWGTRRLRFVHTPGHGSAACSIVMDVDERQVVFVGDAAHAGATIWQPWHLEWDHWTASGALAAREGVERLRGIAADLICPSHGPVVTGRGPCSRLLGTLSSRLFDFAGAKGHMGGPHADGYIAPAFAGSAFRRYCENLFQFGTNGYLLRSSTGAALVVDPTAGDLPHLRQLLAETGARVETCVVTHCHGDHCDGVPELRRQGARLVLHPWVAEPLHDVRDTRAPWLPREDLRPDETWPEAGEWRWYEYTFRVAPFPGQTLWHCAFAARVDGHLVAFVGDTFQPASRWNGTGGFCAYNRSLFRAGFERSARLLLDWAPEWLAAGHGTVSRFQPSRFRDVIRWSRRAEHAVSALCHSGSLERDYYAWGIGGERTPYRRERPLASGAARAALFRPRPARSSVAR